MDRSNPSLSTLGQVQAKALGRVLGQLDDVEAIYSSPLARTMETAKAISLPLGFPVNIHEGLAELDIGPLEGMTSEERLINYPEFSSQWAHDPTTAVLSGVESLSHLQERAWDAIHSPLGTTDDRLS
jgi:broad specificity phosphatase PhoE